MEREFMDLLNDAWTKLIAKLSNTVAINTDDYIRLQELLYFIGRTYLDKQFNQEFLDKLNLETEQSRNKYPLDTPPIYLYDPAIGLSTVRYHVVKKGPEVTDTQDLYVSYEVAQQKRDAMDPLSKLFNTVHMYAGEGKEVITIFYRIRRVENSITHALVDDLINHVTKMPKFYNSNSKFFIMASSIKSILAHDTLRKVIYVDPPSSTRNERRLIIKAKAKKYGVEVDEKKLLEAVEATSGLPLEDVEGIIVESILVHGDINIETLLQYKYEVLSREEHMTVVKPDYGFEAVGGYDYIKHYLNMVLGNYIKRPDLAVKIGGKPAMGILLYGPPGTGKTHLAKALAGELNIPFVETQASKLYSKYYGETTRNIEKLIKTCEEIGPVILFIDEIDQLGRRGHSTEHEESRRAFSTLLSWLGDPNRKTIVIGTTNRPQDMDPAFLRAGRMDLKIPILYPTWDARYEILKIHSKRLNLNLADDVDFEVIANETEMWQGAELVRLLSKASNYALQDALSGNEPKIYQRHLERALNTSSINVEERRREMEMYIDLAYKYTDDKELLDKVLEAYNIRESKYSHTLYRGFR